MPGADPIVLSKQTQTIKGECYYVHIVQKGQTVFSIARAYGLKEQDARLKTNANNIRVGDTVWLPCRWGNVEMRPRSEAVTVVRNAPAEREPVVVSGQIQVLNGQRYYVHVVQRGQTVYSITRAYGVKEYDAVVKKDIHFLDIGDTVWLPCSKVPASVVANVASKASKRDANTSSHSASSDTAVIRPRINPDRVVVSLMMPLFLDQMANISTTKFDIEQRGKTTYKSFEFIQFYEGFLLGLQRLEQQGIKVTLNVVDVPDNNAATVEKIFNSHHVEESDFVVALLPKQPFAKVAELGRKHHVRVVNPIATRGEIVRDNPYVIKCAPSDVARLTAVFDMVHRDVPASHLLIVHSGTSTDKDLLQTAIQLLDQRADIQYSTLSWSSNSKLPATLHQHPSTVVLSLYNQGQSKNRIYAGQMLNKLSADKNKLPRLITLDDWTTLFNDLDYGQLQNLSYTTFYGGWDYTNPSHVDFLQSFRELYKTEPVEQYAAMGNDIALFFVSGLAKGDVAFWRHPVQEHLDGLLFPLAFSQATPTSGLENHHAELFRLENFVFRRLQ
ncbi:MAG: LysM peptidoglycan-binding domain-containing protein [Bacteroidales bacterium]|nr:LysM peptidoglycan-binding domain-containing protein [Bacteroidales bacterium]